MSGMIGSAVSGKFRKKPVVIEATRWFKNGDHPLDYSKDLDMTTAKGEQVTAAFRKEHQWEGDIVRYFRRPDVPDDRECKHCHRLMYSHGWIDTKEGGHIVCPGDWIITGVAGEMYPCKPDIFEATYEDATIVRKLDEKFHIAGNEIIKTSNGEAIPLDEPVFLFRARDRLALKALAHYFTLSMEDGCNDYHFDHLNKDLDAFERFAKEHPERMKQPSITRGK